MSTASLSQTFASKVIDPITEQNQRRCCSIGSCTKKVFDLTTAVFAGIGNWPFYQSHGGKLSSWNTFLKVCEGSSRFLFSFNNFQIAYAKMSEQKEVVVPTEIALKDLRNEDEPVSRNTTSQCNQRTCLKVSVTALAFSAQIPFVLYSYYTKRGSWVYPLATGLCDAAFSLISLWKSRNEPSVTVQNDLQGISFEEERKKQEFLKQIDAFLLLLGENYQDKAFVAELQSIFFQSYEVSRMERSEQLLQMIIKYGKRGKEELAEPGCFSRFIPAAFGALIALYLSAIYGTISYRGIELWDKDQQGLAIISSIVTSLINLRFLSKLCMNSSKGYYETFRSIVSCNYHAPLGFAASKKIWVIGRIAMTCLSYLSFRSIASVLEENMPYVGGELSLFAPIASGILLNDSLNRTFDHFLLSSKACCNQTVNALLRMQKGLSHFKKYLQEQNGTDVASFLNLLPVELAPVSKPATDKTRLLDKTHVYSESLEQNSPSIAPSVPIVDEDGLEEIPL